MLKSIIVVVFVGIGIGNVVVVVVVVVGGGGGIVSCYVMSVGKLIRLLLALTLLTNVATIRKLCRIRSLVCVVGTNIKRGGFYHSSCSPPGSLPLPIGL